jgi:hypothetical protein
LTLIPYFNPVFNEILVNRIIRNPFCTYKYNDIGIKSCYLHSERKWWQEHYGKIELAFCSVIKYYICKFTPRLIQPDINSSCQSNKNSNFLSRPQNDDDCMNITWWNHPLHNFIDAALLHSSSSTNRTNWLIYLIWFIKP